MSTVSTQLLVSTRFRKKYSVYVQLLTKAVPRRLLPFKTWYPLLPAVLHRTTTDPHPAAKRLHLPFPHLSHTPSLLHLTDALPIRTLRGRAGATISAHVNMQHLQLHLCESTLKVAQLSRHMSWDRSFSEWASTWITMGHCARLNMDLTWESETFAIGEWEQKRDGQGSWWVASSFPEQTQWVL